MTSIGDVTADMLSTAVLRRSTESIQRYIMSLKQRNIWWFDILNEKTGESPLHVAVRSEYMPIIKFLCESCHEEGDARRSTCDTCSKMLEISNKMGKKALHEAAIMCNPTMISYLLKLGAKVDSLKSGDWTALMIVCTKNGLRAARSMELLLDAGADPLLTNKDGWTPLHIACRTGNLEVVRILLRCRAEAITSTSRNGRTPLHVACLHGHKAVVEELCKFGYPLDPVDACGLTPLHEAVRGGHVDLFRFLVIHGADIRNTDGMEMTCLHLAASSARRKMIKILLLEFDFMVDEPTKTGKLTALHCAVRAGHMDTVKALRRYGANPHLQDAKGRQAADFCNGSDREEMMTVLTSRINALDFPIDM